MAEVRIIPKYRLKCCLKVVHSVIRFSASNMVVEMRCIVDVPHMKPNIIPPKSVFVGVCIILCKCIVLRVYYEIDGMIEKHREGKSLTCKVIHKWSKTDETIHNHI